MPRKVDLQMRLSPPEFPPVVDHLLEVVAETGVPADTLSDPQLMGFMADPAMKPDVLFLLRRPAPSRWGKTCKS